MNPSPFGTSEPSFKTMHHSFTHRFSLSGYTEVASPYISKTYEPPGSNVFTYDDNRPSFSSSLSFRKSGLTHTYWVVFSMIGLVRVISIGFWVLLLLLLIGSFPCIYKLLVKAYVVLLRCYRYLIVWQLNLRKGVYTAIENDYSEKTSPLLDVENIEGEVVNENDRKYAKEEDSSRISLSDYWIWALDKNNREGWKMVMLEALIPSQNRGYLIKKVKDILNQNNNGDKIVNYAGYDGSADITNSSLSSSESFEISKSGKEFINIFVPHPKEEYHNIFIKLLVSFLLSFRWCIVCSLGVGSYSLSLGESVTIKRQFNIPKSLKNQIVDLIGYVFLVVIKFLLRILIQISRIILVMLYPFFESGYKMMYNLYFY
jgi:hypothetical protein